MKCYVTAAERVQKASGGSDSHARCGNFPKRKFLGITSQGSLRSTRFWNGFPKRYHIYTVSLTFESWAEERCCNPCFERREQDRLCSLRRRFHYNNNNKNDNNNNIKNNVDNKCNRTLLVGPSFCGKTHLLLNKLQLIRLEDPEKQIRIITRSP